MATIQMKPQPKGISVTILTETPLPDTFSQSQQVACKIGAVAPDAVQAAAKEQLASGKSIQGWTMRVGRKTKFWKDEKLVQEAFKDMLIAWELKSPSAVLKLGVEVSEDLVGEKVAAASLVRSKE